ncbi:unnamed protein product [Lactuca saligna]|uniref:Uncharacterized protein n=1 Tax=Lactuca saligna TaxID=75948 RepID=A0AA35YTM7_LACSI|nr:unnamed protein product [Lactuca saligna]
MVKCLYRSPLATALTIAENVHLFNLSKIESVSASTTLLKQRGEAKKASGEEIKKPASGSDKHEQKLKTNDPKGNEASGSKEIDENLRIAKEAKAREKEAREAQVTMETQKLLFPSWSRKYTQN